MNSILPLFIITLSVVLLVVIMTRNWTEFFKQMEDVEIVPESQLQRELVASTSPPQQSTEIPYLLLMTYKDLKKIPAKVHANLKKYAPEYTVRMYDDDAAIQFLAEHFDPQVLAKFRKLKQGAHKADLLRYCLLYIYGGVYLDVKTELLHPLRDLMHNPARSDVTLITVYDWENGAPSRIYNGIIASVPGNPLFLQLIHNILITPVIWYYHVFIRQFFLLLEYDLNGGSVEPGKILRGQQNTIYLFHQGCSFEVADCPDGLDRYGLCCWIYDHTKKIFKVRYSDFPW